MYWRTIRHFLFLVSTERDSRQPHSGWNTDFLLFPFDGSPRNVAGPIILCLGAVIFAQLVADGLVLILVFAMGSQDLKRHALQICLEGGSVVVLLPGHFQEVRILLIWHCHLKRADAARSAPDKADNQTKQYLGRGMLQVREPVCLHKAVACKNQLLLLKPHEKVRA